MTRVMQSLARVWLSLSAAAKRRPRCSAFTRTQELQAQLAFILESEEKNTVVWIAYRGDGRPHALRFKRTCLLPSHAH